MNANSSSAHPRQRQLIGWLEAYWVGGEYAGHRMVAESAQACGSEHRKEVRLASDITINRSFSKVKILKAGTVVVQMVSPLQGREV